MKERLEDRARRGEEALHAGSVRAIERQHSRGKMTARERIDYLLDEGSFQELDMLARHRAHGMGIEESRPYTDGVITGGWTLGSAAAGMPNADAGAHSLMSGVPGCGPGLSFGGVLVRFAL